MRQSCLANTKHTNLTLKALEDQKMSSMILLGDIFDRNPWIWENFFFMIVEAWRDETLVAGLFQML